MPAPSRGDVVRIRDERWTVCRRVSYGDTSIIEVRGLERTNRGVCARFLLPAEPLDRLPPTAGTRAVGRRKWRALARQVLASAAHSWESLRTLPAARIDILPFQLEPALALMRGAAARILLADEVGLGKTIQAGLILAETLERAPEARALVVCPAALRQQWAEELQQRFALEPALIDSAALARPGSRVLPGASPWNAHPLVIASIDYIKRPEVLRALESVIWDVVIVDEAHGLANRSDRQAAGLVLGQRARALVMLTATPHSGDEQAFTRLCGLGDLDRRFPLAVFRRTRHDVGLASLRRAVWLAIAPTDAELGMHRALMIYAQRVWHERTGARPAARLAITILLRRASSSAGSLARSVERRLQLLTSSSDALLQLPLPLAGAGADDDEPAVELGAPGLIDAHAEKTMLEQILELGRAAHRAESKLNAVRRLLRRSGEPAIVFTEYRDTLAALAAELGDFDCVQLHGALATPERQDVLRQFTSGRAQVLLATDAASEGLNLHHRCRLVINLEVPWTPVRLEQRVGRVDRIGQRRRVHQVQLVAAGTPEASTVAPSVRRRVARVTQTLEAMRSAQVDQQEIAASIVDQAPAVMGRLKAAPTITSNAAPAIATDAAPTIILVDVRDAARQEAARASLARALGADAASVLLPLRPFATAVHHQASRGCWAFRVGLCDEEDEPLWETILGVTYRFSLAHFTRPGTMLAHVDRSRDALQPAVRRHSEPLVGARSESLRGSVALAIARERSILTAVERHHARLAALLIQPALFDRRVERDGAAQRDVFEDVANRCRERLARLARRQHPKVAPPEAVFALVRR